MRTIKGVVMLAAIDWKFLKQRPQHLAEALAGKGLPVLFVENTGVRVPSLSDWPRLWDRLRNMRSRGGLAGRSDHSGQVEVFSPLAVPLPYNRLALSYNQSLLGRRVRSFCRQHSLDPGQVLLLSYLATPLAGALAGEIAWGSVVYDVVSDPKQVSPRLAPHEARFLNRADVTLFASQSLRDLYGDRPAHPVLLRDGYNPGLLGWNQEGREEIARLPRPRFLYLGGINRKVDPEYLACLADAFPAGSLMLVGPVAPAEIELPERSNIYLFPSRKRYEEIACFLRAADAALIPYRGDAYAGMMHPAKINEYMVFGLPIIAAMTPELRYLQAELGEGSLYLAGSPGEFAAAAQQALTEDSPGRREERRKIAELNSWDSRAESLMAIVAGER